VDDIGERRSKRRKVRPLQYWRGERVDYGRAPGAAVPEGVPPLPPQPRYSYRTAPPCLLRERERERVRERERERERERVCLLKIPDDFEFARQFFCGFQTRAAACDIICLMRWFV
jgi:hypothetical protein